MMLDGSTRIARALALALTVALGGCWNLIVTHCPECTIVSDRAPLLPRLRPDTRVVVIIVHGAFGFGDEWRQVVETVHAHPHSELIAFSWSGPWTRKPSLAAEALRRLVQRAVDEAPPRAEILVLGHSAGGALTAYVGERLRVPNGRRVRLISIAAPEGMNLSPYRPEYDVDTPLGFAVGGEQAPPRPIAPGVEYVEYITDDPPPPPLPGSPPPRVRPGVRRVYLGHHVRHTESVGVAALPIVRAL
jgi:hypothetical protein